MRLPIYYYISPEMAVFEVAYDSEHTETEGLWCSCPGFTVRKDCRHVDITKQSITKEALLSRDEKSIDWDNIPSMSSQDFRYFIIQNMRIEVLTRAGE